MLDKILFYMPIINAIGLIVILFILVNWFIKKNRNN